jgi:hypothetical protein
MKVLLVLNIQLRWAAMVTRRHGFESCLHIGLVLYVSWASCLCVKMYVSGG